MRESKDPRYLRLKLAQYAQAHGNKPAARVFGTTVKTVRKWRGRYEAGGYHALVEESRSPKHPARRITPRQRAQAIDLKRRLPSFGARRLKRDFGLSLSAKALRRIWQEEGLLRRKRKKSRTKADLRAVKAQWRLFQQVDLDTKHLYDIPEFWPQMRRLGLPRYQFTAREVVSGLQFLAFAHECSLDAATRFAQLLIRHTQRCGVSFEGAVFQTDNGPEFIGAWNAKADSAFTRTVQQTQGLAHLTIPPAAHTYQADVETVHRLIEDEFYEVEYFASKAHFLAKSAAYLLWFNVARKNSYKGQQTPWEIIHHRDPAIRPDIACLPPVILDEPDCFNVTFPGKGGYDVGTLP